MQDDQKKIELLSSLGDLFGFSFSETSFLLYMNCLESLSAENLKEIIQVGLKTNKWQFMPKPGEILEAFQMAPEKEIKLDGRTHFAYLIRSARNGRYDPSKVNEASESAIRSLGGYSAFTQCEDKDIQWLERRFLETYALFAEKNLLDGHRSEIKSLSSGKSHALEIQGISTALAEKMKIK